MSDCRPRICECSGRCARTRLGRAGEGAEAGVCIVARLRLIDVDRDAERCGLAIGETVILLTPPVSSLLKHLLKVQWGAIK